MALLHRVRAVWSGWQGGPGLSTFYFHCSTPPLLADAQDVADRVRAGMLTIASIVPNT